MSRVPLADGVGFILSADDGSVGTAAASHGIGPNRTGRVAGTIGQHTTRAPRDADFARRAAARGQDHRCNGLINESRAA